MKKIAVIMTVHNRCAQTIACLQKLSEEKQQCDIYLTDDGCTDGTAAAVRNGFPQVTIVEGDGTLFWNRGMRKAWEVAARRDYDFYLWLNDDTTLLKDALSRLLALSTAKGNQSIIVGSTQNLAKELSYGGRKANRKHSFIKPLLDKEIECDTFNGNIVLIPNSVFKVLGYNDSYFHHSFGDIEYGLRAKKNGIISYIAPGYYGICERNNPVPLFRRKQYSLCKRYKLLYSPLGFNPKEDFHLNKMYYPLYLCILWFIKLHINVLFTLDHTKL